MEVERDELRRLLNDSKQHGNYYISNFSENGVMTMPIYFNSPKEYHILNQTIIDFF